jgi:hypothetical protein
MTTNGTKLSNFVHAFGAARLLLRKANEEGNFLEALVLYAALTDGFQRIGLVLRGQIKDKNSEIDPLLISQEKNGQYYSERQIQRRALAEDVIKQDAFNELSTLYDFRNDAIHKFFLTGLQYADLAPVLERYEIMFNKLYGIVYELECEQIGLGVGMTSVDQSGGRTAEIRKEILKKIDSKAKNG